MDIDRATVLITALGVAVGVVGLWWMRKQTHHAARAADIGQKTYKADNVANLLVDAKIRFMFPGYDILDEGIHYTLDPPDAFTQPVPVLHTTARNRGKVPVTVTDAGIRLTRTAQFIRFSNNDSDRSASISRPAYELTNGQLLNIVVSLHEVRRLLKLLAARPEDNFVVEVESAAGDCHRSSPRIAADYLDEDKRFAVAIQHDPQITVSPLSEEEELPEGWAPGQ